MAEVRLPNSRNSAGGASGGPGRQILQGYQSAMALGPQDLGLACPYGIGDTYLVAALAELFMDRYQGASLSVLVKAGQVDIPALFPAGAKRTFVMEEAHVAGFREFSHRGPQSFGLLLVAHPRNHVAFTPSPHHWHPKISMLEQYLRFFQLPANTALAVPVVTAELRHQALERLQRHELPPGRTVILAPEAASLTMLPAAFWSTLGQRLQTAGWTVCLNQSGSEQSPSWPGLPHLHFPLREALPLAELAGWVISLRSGLCDLLASAACRLSVIYPKPRWAGLSPLQQYGLRPMRPVAPLEEFEIGSQEDAWSVIEMLGSG